MLVYTVKIFLKIKIVWYLAADSCAYHTTGLTWVKEKYIYLVCLLNLNSNKVNMACLYNWYSHDIAL